MPLALDRLIILLAKVIIGGLMAVLAPPSLMDNGSLLIFALIAGLFGAMLGFLQVFAEAQGDKRSLLLHRPLSRSQIFLAKASVGVGLYLLALGIPFALAVGLAATPGHIAEPFSWPMTLRIDRYSSTRRNDRELVCSFGERTWMLSGLEAGTTCWPARAAAAWDTC
jgi:hypothetical protein